MLKNINPHLNAELLYVLDSMGHGDELVLSDCNFPSHSTAISTITGKLIYMDGLDIPKEQKLLLDVGEQGAGKDMEKGYEAANKYKQNIFDLMRKVYGNNVDHLNVCVGAGGGSGSGSSLVLIDIAKKYMKYIGHDNPDERVGV